MLDESKYFAIICYSTVLNLHASDADELEWYIPAAILPSELQRSSNVIKQFLETPLDLGGKKASDMLSKSSRKRRRRRRAASDDEDGDQQLESDDEPKKRRAKKKKEEVKYKSVQLIEDSDEEVGDDELFWARERALRERTERLAAEGKSANMRSSGTKKKRKKKGVDSDENNEKDAEPEDVSDPDTSDSDGVPSASRKSPPQAKQENPSEKRARPRPAFKGKESFDTEVDNHDQRHRNSRQSSPETTKEAPASEGESGAKPSRKRGRVVFSEDEDD